MKKLITNTIFITVIAFAVNGQPFNIGDKVPDIVAKDLNGKEIKLSSLQGKVVLVDFWAGWCAPCRKENPNIVKTYLKYKDATFDNGQGFTVFSVSLDMQKPMWQRAVQKDSLIWPYHVSDLKGWRSPIAKLYGIGSIPNSYLIDGDGIVVAVNPRGDALENKLRKLEKRRLFSFD